MLQAINDRIKGWLGIVIIVVIGLPFGLWGIQSYLDDTGPKYAAKVNDTEISAYEFERAVTNQRQSLQRRFGANIPLEENALRDQALNQIINTRLLEGETYNNGYRISDAVLSEKIRQQFSTDGVFDRARFEATVEAVGMNIPAYEHALRSELRLQQIQAAVANSSFVTQSEVNKLAALEQQKRDITVLTFDVNHFSTAADPTADEIKQYYDTNIQQYMEPEKVKVDYVELTSESLGKDIAVDEAQIKKMYDDYVASVIGREQRKASHILIETPVDDADSRDKAKAKIESIKKELDDGADFARLASEYSDDKGTAEEGGDLGWVSTGEMVKPFEDALFAMKLSNEGKSTVSDIVETQFGYHLIKLDAIKKEKIEPLEAKRAEFESELKVESASSMFYDQGERLAAIAYENPDSLDAVVEQLGLKVMSTGYFTRNNGEGIAENEKVRNIAFSPLVLEQGSNSDIIEINPTHVVVLRLNEHVPATAIPLATVRDKIVASLKARKGHEQTRQAALAVKSKIEAGEDIESLKSDGIGVKTITELGRNDFSKVGDPAILKTTFDEALGEDGKPAVEEIDLASGNIALVVLTKVNTPDVIAADKLSQVKNEAISENAVRDFSNLLQYLKNNATIHKNKRVLEN